MKTIYLLSVLIFIYCQQPGNKEVLTIQLPIKSESSIVGNWENSQIEKCKKAVKPMTNDPRFKIILKDYNKTAEQFCECYCEEIEKKYKSFDEASKKMTDEEEHNKLQKYCFTGTDNFKK